MKEIYILAKDEIPSGVFIEQLIDKIEDYKNFHSEVYPNEIRVFNLKEKKFKMCIQIKEDANGKIKELLFLLEEPEEAERGRSFKFVLKTGLAVIFVIISLILLLATSWTWGLKLLAILIVRLLWPVGLLFIKIYAYFEIGYTECEAFSDKIVQKARNLIN